MDDEEYARELLAILTRPPDPDVPPWELGDDWIDRSDGFGTDLRVTSIDVVPGEHGAQIDVGFALDLPAELELPERGSLVLPLDREWRQVSGFEEPEDYAPRVAMQLMRNLVRLHPRRPSDVDLPTRDQQHALLVHVLGRYGEVEEQAPGRYVVTGHGRTLTALITADQWEEVLRKKGLPHDATDHYDELLASRGRGESFLVFWDGELTSSTREKLPPAKTPFPPLREVRRNIAEAKASGKDFGWFAYEPGSQD